MLLAAMLAGHGAEFCTQSFEIGKMSWVGSVCELAWAMGWRVHWVYHPAGRRVRSYARRMMFVTSFVARETIGTGVRGLWLPGMKGWVPGIFATD